MQTIQELINKIKWDKRENPKLYLLYYIDRFSNKLIEIRFSNIKNINDGFITIEKSEEETNIPLHRIKLVKKGNDIIWRRNF